MHPTLRKCSCNQGKTSPGSDVAMRPEHVREAHIAPGHCHQFRAGLTAHAKPNECHFLGLSRKRAFFLPALLRWEDVSLEPSVTVTNYHSLERSLLKNEASTEKAQKRYEEREGCVLL